MAEQPLPHELDAVVHRLYVRRLSHLSFELPQGNLRDALLEMYSEEMREQMGQRALILYSEDQTREYRPASQEARATELLDSIVTKRIKHLKSKQYKPARWIDAERPSDTPATLFRMNVLLDTSTQEQLHASVRDGLEQAKFGRKAVTVALRIPDTDIANTPEQRRAASRSIREALWAQDDVATEPNPLTMATGQRNYVTHIDWSSSTK